VSNFIVEEIISDLEKVEYWFYVQGTTIFLDRKSVLRRESKRHSFKLIEKDSYSRLEGRNLGIKEEPEVDIDIQLLAISTLRKKIIFKRWRNG
jgi:hypothetical protein